MIPQRRRSQYPPSLFSTSWISPWCRIFTSNSYNEPRDNRSHGSLTALVSLLDHYKGNELQ